MSDKETSAHPGLGDPAPPPVASSRHTTMFLCLLAGGVLGSFFAINRFLPTYTGSRPLLYLILLVNQLVFVGLIAMGVHARGGTIVELIGNTWRSPWDALRDVFIGALALAVTVVSSGLVNLMVKQSPEIGALARLLPKNPVEVACWIFTATSVGICEEIIFRGYLQRQFWALTGSLSAAIVLQGAIFGACHLYQGWGVMVELAFYGCAAGLLAAWRKSLLPNIAAHALDDIVGGIIASR